MWYISPSWKSLALICAVAVGTFMLSAPKALAMDHGKFDTIDKIQWANRQRNLQSGALKYFVAAESSKIVENEWVAEIALSSDAAQELVRGRPEVTQANTAGNRLRLHLSILNCGVPRVRITEIESPHRRYEVQDVILDGVKAVEDLKTTDKSGGLTLSSSSFPDISIDLDYDPFRVRIFRGDSVVAEMNSADLMNFETGKDNTAEGNAEDSSYSEDFMSVSLDISLPSAKHVYGIPERAMDLALENTQGNSKPPYRMYNLDIFEYELDNNIGLYGVIPLLMGITGDGSSTFGMLWLNAAETWMDLDDTAEGKRTRWFSESGVIDVYILTGGATPAVVWDQYAALTGTVAMPQRFALGYHQCRWNYKDEADVAQVDAGFDTHNIPYDVLWLDIEHTDGKRYFTWDKHLFPTPKDMLNKIAAKGRKMVTISDPHIKRDQNYYVFKEGKDQGYLVKKRDSDDDYDGWCWPGSSSWVDFFNPKAREWYASLYSHDRYSGSTPSLYTWIDMNEPSVFTGPEVTMDRKGAEHKVVVGETEEKVLHRDVHNMYGYYHGMATYDGHVYRSDKTDRPFVLSRSFYAGSQRYVAVWTGDNAAEWDHLRMATPMLLSLNIAGLPFVGADAGGFFGNPSTELLTRWYQSAAFTPFFRGHAHLETKRREPWLFGEEVTRRVREAVWRRYAMMPVWYSAFRKAHLTGQPILRPLWAEFPLDPHTHSLSSTFLLEHHTLVVPVSSEGVSQLSTYLPAGSTWYDMERGGTPFEGGREVTLDAPLDRIPVLVRGGAILPRWERLRRSTAQQALDPYTMLIALDPSSQSASGYLYIDDGSSFDYEKGEYIDVSLSFEGGVFTSEVTNSPANGYTVPNRIERVVIYGLSSSASRSLSSASVSQGGEKWTVDVQVSGDSVTVRKPWCRVAEKCTISLL